MVGHAPQNVCKPLLEIFESTAHKEREYTDSQSEHIARVKFDPDHHALQFSCDSGRKTIECRAVASHADNEAHFRMEIRREPRSDEEIRKGVATTSDHRASVEMDYYSGSRSSPDFPAGFRLSTRRFAMKLFRHGPSF